MPRRDSPYPRDWLRIAARDLDRVQSLLQLDDPEAAGLFLQQAIEKLLKAFLLAHGWRLKHIHDLEALLNAALSHDPSLEAFRPPCQKITAFYLLARYPTLGEGSLTTEDVRGAHDEVAGLVARIRKAFDQD